jgi:acyl carrier protein
MPMALSREQVIERLCALAAEQVDVDAAVITADTNLFADLNFDSLDVVEYMMMIEEQFEVSIPDERAEEVKTIGQAADAVLALLR